MMHRVLAWIVCAASVVSLSIWFPRSEPDRPRKIEPPVPVVAVHLRGTIEYNRDILPILSNKCFTCHGPDSSSRKAGLRLDQRDSAVKPTKLGDVPIVPGKSTDSALVHRIFANDDKERMPPRKTGKSLTAIEKDLLKRWIDQGAEYQVHWAFITPQRPSVPVVKNRAWMKNEIDAFILAKIEAAGLEPSPRADLVTLIRRLSFDLRGLPPTLDEVDHFLAANRDPNATPQIVWEKLVDRMLASSRYGEKMALHWLDLARYGDTSGYHMDSTRQMWPWRDWVIDAFNQNMPFDQFTIEQLAGDLLPNATDKQKIASGFNRNTRYNEEGGVDPDEYVIRYNIDRTNTLGQVWLGLTLGCAECHTHKYDPITHKEYYQLFAYFTGIKEPMLEGHSVHGKPLPPFLKVPSPEQAASLAELQKKLDAVERTIAKELARFNYKDPLTGKPEQSQVVWEMKAKESLKEPAEVRSALQIVAAERDQRQRKAIHDYYVRYVNEAGREYIAPFQEDVDELTKKLKTIDDAIPRTLVSEEMTTPRPAHVLIRGDFQQKGELVERGVPAWLTPMPITGTAANRLALARWLVHPDHSLTARVAVNRLWAQMFGAGIVRTIGDFGTQGDYPSHPELLDWLATEFLNPFSRNAEGVRAAPRTPAWDIKHLLRTIATSSTYQQSSVYRDDAAKLDPPNRLLAFMPRFRLSAEELRDNALAISGVLSKKVGGPSFMPYQPAEYFRFKNEGWPWKTSEGDDQYRRGMYAFWRRTALHPMFVTFDAPTREECTVSRPRTNTPLQALVTLNDSTFVEAARVFAERVLTQGPNNVDARLALVFRRATCRTPSSAEMNVLRHRFEQQRARFRMDADAASRLVNVGQYPRDARLDVSELAAWTALCNMVLNLDEVLTRE